MSSFFLLKPLSTIIRMSTLYLVKKVFYFPRKWHNHCKIHERGFRGPPYNSHF